MTAGDLEGDLESYARARIGTVLRGKYTLDALVGVGGMAVVYKATHRNQAEFAVKMLHPELSIREEVRTRFLREGYAANSVKHPGVVLVVDDEVTEDGGAFLVMELLDGVGCDHAWERCDRRMPLDAACTIAHQLLDVLSAAHAKGIIHRDIKPANLFITREGRVKVLDFGIARVRDVAATNVTMSGILLGTPAFMGPEQALATSKEIDAQTDVWAVGASLFTLMSGVLVHDGENAQQIMVKAATQKARSLGEVAPEVPASIIAVVDRALAFSKGDRWPSAAAMRSALGTAFESVFGRPPAASSLVELVQRGNGAPERLSALAPTANDPVLPTLPMTVVASPKLTEIVPSGARVVAIPAPATSVPHDRSRRSGALLYTSAGGLLALLVAGGIWKAAAAVKPEVAIASSAALDPSAPDAPFRGPDTATSSEPGSPAPLLGSSAPSVVHGGSVSAAPMRTTPKKCPEGMHLDGQQCVAPVLGDSKCLEGSIWNGTACVVRATSPSAPAAAPEPPPTAVAVPAAPPGEPPPRFTSSAGTIHDAQTGRTWQARLSGPVTFDSAQSRCGGGGFRLPSEGELRGIGGAEAAVFGDLTSFCWTSTRRVAGSTRVSVVQPRGASKEVFANDSSVTNMVRCVR